MSDQKDIEVRLAVVETKMSTMDTFVRDYIRDAKSAIAEAREKIAALTTILIDHTRDEEKLIGGLQRWVILTLISFLTASASVIVYLVKLQFFG